MWTGPRADPESGIDPVHLSPPRPPARGDPGRGSIPEGRARAARAVQDGPVTSGPPARVTPRALHAGQEWSVARTGQSQLSQSRAADPPRRARAKSESPQSVAGLGPQRSPHSSGPGDRPSRGAQRSPSLRVNRRVTAPDGVRYRPGAAGPGRVWRKTARRPGDMQNPGASFRVNTVSSGPRAVNTPSHTDARRARKLPKPGSRGKYKFDSEVQVSTNSGSLTCPRWGPPAKQRCTL